MPWVVGWVEWPVWLLSGNSALHLFIGYLLFFPAYSCLQVATAIERANYEKEVTKAEYVAYCQALVNHYAETAEAYWNRFTLMLEVFFYNSVGACEHSFGWASSVHFPHSLPPRSLQHQTGRMGRVNDEAVGDYG